MLASHFQRIVQNVVLLHLITSLGVNGQRSEDELDTIVERMSGQPVEPPEKESELKARSGSSGRRRKLPDGNLFTTGLEPEALECGKSYSIDKDGYRLFNLVTPETEKPCHYSFLGSWKNSCTVAMLCKGKIALSPPTSGKGCENEYLLLSDGTVGMMTGCGNFSFRGKPRIPRNNGSDLYVTIKGSSPKKCYALCLEELGENREGINEVHHISANKNWKGFETESDCACGAKHDFSRIVGGVNAKKFEFPWIGNVVFSQPKIKRQPFCGGSLINDRYFLSAAHCFAIDKIRPEEIQILLHAQVMDKRLPRRVNEDDPMFKDIPGWNLPNETDESEDTLRLDVEEIINHPLFNSRTFDFDIAIVKFKSPLELSKSRKVQPICLPDVYPKLSFQKGDIMTVAGWGLPTEKAKAPSRILQKLDVPFLPNDECMKYVQVVARHLCAGYIEGAKDACAGDSGGPLIYKFDVNKYLLTGVVSAGAGCARKDQLGLYTDVQEMVQWVYEHTKGAKWCARQPNDS